MAKISLLVVILVVLHWDKLTTLALDALCDITLEKKV